MNKALAIAKRELKSYFDSPIAYIVIVAFLLVAGWMFFSTVFLIGRADLRTFFTPTPFSPALLLVILAPAITMRLISEERKSGTIELLSSMPVTNAEVVLGKYLAALGLTGVALLSTLVYAITVTAIGSLDWGPVVSGYLGIILFAATLLSIGLMCSSFTANQIVAFIVSFLILAVLYYIQWLQFFVPGWLGGVVDFVSVSSHLDNMARGVIDTRDVFYYLTVIAAALFLSERALHRSRA